MFIIIMDLLLPQTRIAKPEMIPSMSPLVAKAVFTESLMKKMKINSELR